MRWQLTCIGLSNTLHTLPKCCGCVGNGDLNVGGQAQQPLIELGQVEGGVGHWVAAIRHGHVQVHNKGGWSGFQTHSGGGDTVRVTSPRAAFLLFTIQTPFRPRPRSQGSHIILGRVHSNQSSLLSKRPDDGLHPRDTQGAHCPHGVHTARPFEIHATFRHAH